jgi:hypothetical protein
VGKSHERRRKIEEKKNLCAIESAFVHEKLGTCEIRQLYLLLDMLLFVFWIIVISKY